MNPRFQQQRRRRSNLSVVALFLLAILLFVPFLSSVRLATSLDPQFVYGYLAFITTITFWLYWHDKRRAEVAGWRTAELTLRLAELFGGWPAAFLAQRIFRHKISETRYQARFWTIVTFHETVSFDFLSDWQYSRAVMRLIMQP